MWKQGEIFAGHHCRNQPDGKLYHLHGSSPPPTLNMHPLMSLPHLACVSTGVLSCPCTAGYPSTAMVALPWHKVTSWAIHTGPSSPLDKFQWEPLLYSWTWTTCCNLCLQIRVCLMCWYQPVKTLTHTISSPVSTLCRTGLLSTGTINTEYYCHPNRIPNHNDKQLDAHQDP